VCINRCVEKKLIKFVTWNLEKYIMKIGSETSKEYVDIANERLKNYTMNSLFTAK
jgi:hypothetical protein